MNAYLLFVFGEVSQKPDGFILDLFGVSVGDEKLGIDDVMVVLRSSIRSLIVDEYFWRSFAVEEQLHLLTIGLVAEDIVLNGGATTLTKSSFSPNESAMHPRIHKNFFTSSLLIQIKLKVIFLWSIRWFTPTIIQINPSLYILFPTSSSFLIHTPATSNINNKSLIMISHSPLLANA